jgi:hypothetical protein
MAVVTAFSVFAFTPGASHHTKTTTDHYRFTLNDPLMATSSGYVTNVNNWSSDLVPVEEDDLQCQTGDYQPCEIIAPIADVNTSTHKLKGSISASSGSGSFFIVSGYSPTTGTAKFSNRNQ